MKRYLLLEDGSIFEGEAVGAELETTGELVFNTGMSGYQESLTDQSYEGQILLFTYPLIGNYGINSDELESTHASVRGIVINELARTTANRNMNMSLNEFLVQQKVPGIQKVDTRALTKKVRNHGVMKAALLDEVTEHSLEKLQKSPVNHEQVKQVATIKPYPNPSTGNRIVVVDFGLKYSILRELSKRECDVMVMPPSSTADEILACHPAGVLLSNGPGDPMDVDSKVLEMIRIIQEKVPLFGICLGHQLFALANGAKTKKLKFGHRGFNHPVVNLVNQKIDFTSQNHGYAVDANSLINTDLTVTHEELNDHSVEGLRHNKLNAFSVQFHPDAAPGPHDASYLFDDFMKLISKGEF